MERELRAIRDLNGCLRGNRGHSRRVAGYQYGGGASPAQTPRAAAGAYWLWLALAGCGSASLVAVTHVVCQDVAPTALLWSIPLGLYLLSFVITFGGSRWYGRGAGLPLLAGAIMIAFVARCTHSVVLQLPAYLAGCSRFAWPVMASSRDASHRRRAPHPSTWRSPRAARLQHLPEFLPHKFFPDFWEFEIVLWVPGVLVIATAVRDEDSWWYSG